MKEIITETCIVFIFRSYSVLLKNTFSFGSGRPSQLFLSIVSSKTVRTNKEILTLWYMFGFSSFRMNFVSKAL